MKDGALLVNAARGVIVDTGALLAELTSGRIRAALDVTDPEPLPDGHPLWQAPGLLLTPHVGGAVDEARDRAYRVVSEQLARLAAGEPLRNIIERITDINGTSVKLATSWILSKENSERNVVTHDAKR